MSRRGPSSDGTFYFQAWHVDKVVSGESWLHNKAMADFVEQKLSADSKRWLCVRACIPTKEKSGLLVPHSICVKQRVPKIGQNPEDRDRCIVQFRDKEYPAIARSYFLTRLQKTLDFYNAYAEGVDAESPLAKFEVVKASTQLNQRIQAAIRHVKRESWGDVVHGLVESGSDFKATRFLSNRGQDPSANPHELPTAPLQTILLSSKGCDKLSSPTSEPPALDSTSTAASTTDATSECSSSDETSPSSVAEESSQPSIAEESSESCSTEESSQSSVAEESSQSSVAEESSQSSVAEESSQSSVEESSQSCGTEESSQVPSIQESTQSSVSSYDGTVARTSSRAMAPRKKMTCVMSADSQTTVIFLQDAGNWLQHMMASRRNAGGRFDMGSLLDTPIVFAAAISPLQALKPDGTMQVFFMSQARKSKDGSSREGEERRVLRKGKAVSEWVIGSARVPTRVLTKHMQKTIEARNMQKALGARKNGRSDFASQSKEVISVVGPNNQLIEMAPAPDIPGAIIVSADRVEDIREGCITQHEKDGFVHIETNIADRVIELDTEKKKAKRHGKMRRSSPASSRGKDPWNKKIDTNFHHRPAKTYPSPFTRSTWRDAEPQAPQLISDVMSGSNFLHVEDVQVFSFSAVTHDMMRSHTASLEESDGIKVWSPPVVGLFSWVWDHLSVGGRSKSTV